MEIKILGPGCPNCKTLFSSVEKVIKENSIDAKLSKVEDIIEIMNYNIISTPAIVVDGNVIVKGRVPNEKELKLYLRELLNNKLYRGTKKPKNKYHPFDEDAIGMVIEELGEVSVRSYNEAFSILLELAELEETEKIDSEFVFDNEDEIVGWK